MIPDELLDSAAYRTLTAIEKTILIDWLRQYWSLSEGDKKSIATCGMKYTYSHCKTDCAENSFTKARRSIELRGFFEAPPDLQSLRGDDAKLWIPSDRWRSCNLDPRSRARNSKKAERIRRHTRRRREFRLALDGRDVDSAPKNEGDGTHKK